MHLYTAQAATNKAPAGSAQGPARQNLSASCLSLPWGHRESTAPAKPWLQPQSWGCTLSSAPSCSLSPGKQPPSQGPGQEHAWKFTNSSPTQSMIAAINTQQSSAKQNRFTSKPEASIFRSTEHPHTPTKDHRKHWVGRGNKQNKTIHPPTLNCLPADFHICKKSTHRNNLWCWILLNSKYLTLLKYQVFLEVPRSCWEKITNTTTKTKQI